MITQEKLLNYACRECQSAKDMLHLIGGITHIWDDLIDKDKPITEDDINEAFTDCLIHLPRNKFYRENLNELQPVIEHCIQQWITSAQIEKNKDEELYFMSHVIRGAFNSLITRCAFILGGLDHSILVSMAVAKFSAQNEPLEEYIKEIIER